LIEIREPLILKALFRDREIRYSHSNINELSKLLIRRALAAAPQTLSVIFTVNLSGISIGAGFRAVLRRLTFRDLSRTIDSWVAREHFTGAST
jgi:hypothetical protein